MYLDRFNDWQFKSERMGTCMLQNMSVLSQILMIVGILSGFTGAIGVGLSRPLNSRYLKAKKFYISSGIMIGGVVLVIISTFTS